MEDHTWSVRVVADDRRRATVYARNHRFVVGAPVSFDEDEAEVTALETVLGAIGADVAAGLLGRARRHRAEIDRVEIVVRGRLDNALTYLGVVGEEGHPGLTSVRLKVFVSSFEEEEKIQKVWDEMLEKSPLVRTFRDCLRLEFDREIVP